MIDFEEHHINDVIKYAISHNDDFAYRYILKKYEGMIHGIISKRGYYLKNGDNEDLVQEAKTGLYKAINVFNPESASFEAFAQIVIRRHLITAIKKANRFKHQTLNEVYSLDSSLPDNDNLTMMDKIGFRDEVSTLTDIGSMNPEEKFILEETAKIQQEMLEKVLSKKERGVHKLYVESKSYTEIMEELNIANAKEVDNTIQRIKRKSKDVQLLFEKDDIEDISFYNEIQSYKLEALKKVD